MTSVHIARSEWSIRYEDRLLLLGSCFSDNIARKMQEYYLQVTGNPFGTLYNPISIAHHMTDELLADKDVILVTFGTAWVYVDKLRVESGEWSVERGELSVERGDLAAVVDNCQKRPAAEFIRYRLTVEDIVSAWRPILERYSDKRFVFTVSPIRHRKDGLHENQISKAILLQAIDSLTAQRFGSSQDGLTSGSASGQVSYFPSYEIVLDELRDYRYYAEDLVHPSAVAVEYIWERLVETYLYDERTRVSMRELHQLWRDTQHRMLHPETEEAKRFAEHVQAERDRLRIQYPWIE